MKWVFENAFELHKRNRSVGFKFHRVKFRVLVNRSVLNPIKRIAPNIFKILCDIISVADLTGCHLSEVLRIICYCS